VIGQPKNALSHNFLGGVPQVESLKLEKAKEQEARGKESYFTSENLLCKTNEIILTRTVLLKKSDRNNQVTVLKRSNVPANQ